jgi:methionyl-tRNA formyltransferase
VFFGTPSWAVPSLSALLNSDIEVVGVVTNPDRASGRGLRERPAPVKAAAAEAGIEVLQPTRLREPEFQQRLEDLGPDVACVVAYGKILPANLLEVPPLGFVNAHFSLLPALRGAAPVQWSLINGERLTGVSIMVLTEGMDEGPLLARASVEIAPADTAASLGERLADVAAPLLVETVRLYAAGRATPRAQEEDGVSYAPKLSADDVRIDWSRRAAEIHNLIRGAYPEPGAWSTYAGRRMKLLESAETDRLLPPPGRLQLTPDGLFVGCGEGALLVGRAQMQGKRPLPGAELGRGLHLGPEDHLD